MAEIAQAVVLLTLTEAAERLRRTDKQMRWLIHAGKAPRSAIVAGRRMFREVDVNEFIEKAFADDEVA